MKPFVITLGTALLAAFVIVVMLRRADDSIIETKALILAQQEPAKAVNVFTGRFTNVVRICDDGNTVYIAMNTAGRMVTPAIFVVPSMMGGCQ